MDQILGDGAKGVSNSTRQANARDRDTTPDPLGRNDGEPRTMPLSKDLNQRSGYSTISTHGGFTLVPPGSIFQDALGQERRPKKRNPATDVASTLNVLDEQNVHNLLQMVQNTNNGLIRRQYERHSD